ncbi:MAG: TrkH family potassium uptake protein [Candidatus Omnitrophota bacterium]
MIPRPQFEDIRAIGYYLGRIIIGIGLVMLIPIAVSVIAGEISPLFDFIISFSICIAIGTTLSMLCWTKKDLSWMHGMVIVSLSWLIAASLGAIPLFLSGHWKSFLDAFFDAMSGFATTGLTLVQDLDHMSYGHNMWRHLMMFVGGQGIVVVALTFLVRGISGAFKMYVGEAREEKVLPNIISTARFIWMVSIVYFCLGTFFLGMVAFFEGMPLLRSFFHGACIFMAAFDTGGFAPQSQNISYYHSLAFEIVTITIMLLGALNFKLHYALWTGDRKEIRRNIEITTLFITIVVTFCFVVIGLARNGVYPEALSLFRKGFYQLISAHTGTGYSTIYSAQFIREWGSLSLLGIIVAMALGGSSCSTTGGIKALRVSLVFKDLSRDVKKLILPESSVIVEKFHHIKDLILEDKYLRMAFLIIILYSGLYFLGAAIGMICGYPFLNALFESTSAAANVGLSCGITSPSMPTALKFTYIFQMWAGRLEFMSIFVLIAFIIATIRGK